MTEYHSPRRFSKYRDGVSLQEHLEKMFSQRFEFMRDDITEARRVMENRMEGFPSEFAKKSELELTAITLKELKDRDLREIKDSLDARLGRPEYEFQHRILTEKIDAQEKRIQGAELLKAEVTGKIWTLGIVITILVIGVEFVLKYVLKQ